MVTPYKFELVTLRRAADGSLLLVAGEPEREDVIVVVVILPAETVPLAA